MPVKFTVMLCVHRSPAMLPYSIRTVLGQRHGNLELFVVGDGAPAETIACAKAFAAQDDRVRVFDFPKGEQHGEAHRHVALKEASGEFVAHIADDDLWFPGHLTELAALLEHVEFGNLILTGAHPDGSFIVYPGDLADPKTRERMLNERWNFFAPTVAGYRLSTYRRLPVGWSPAPPDVWTDLHMWRKFLQLEGVSVATRFAVESIALLAAVRPKATMQERSAETERWFRLVSDDAGRSALRAKITAAMTKDHAETAEQLLLREQQIRELSRLRGRLKERLIERMEFVYRLQTQVKQRAVDLDREAADAKQQVQSQKKEIERLHRRIDELMVQIS